MLPSTVDYMELYQSEEVHREQTFLVYSINENSRLKVESYTFVVFPRRSQPTTQNVKIIGENKALINVSNKSLIPVE